MDNLSPQATADKIATNPADELRRLRAEVLELKAKLAAIHIHSDVGAAPAPQINPWLQIAATVGVTFALGKAIQLLRLPAAMAVAVPMITAEVNRRYL